MDKAGAREALFGGEPSMDDKPEPRSTSSGRTTRPNQPRQNPWKQSGRQSEDPSGGRKLDGWKRDDDDDDDDDDDWKKRSKQRRAYDKRQREKDAQRKKR
jgi:hypothetical protein